MVCVGKLRQAKEKHKPIVEENRSTLNPAEAVEEIHNDPKGAGAGPPHHQGVAAHECLHEHGYDLRKPLQQVRYHLLHRPEEVFFLYGR
jgi:hypothetical protein